MSHAAIRRSSALWGGPLLLLLQFVHVPASRAQSLEKTMPAGGLHVVVLDTDEGTIRCVGSDMDEVHLTLHGARNGAELRPGDARFEQAIRGDTVIFTVRLRRPSSPFAMYQDALLDLGLPADVAVWARVEDGSIEAKELGAGGRLETRDGGVHAEDCMGSLEVWSRDGEVYVAGHKGPLSVRLRDGSLRASGFFPRLAAESEGGTLNVKLAEGSLARPAGAPGAAPDGYLHSGDGAIKVKLPNELQGILTARSGGSLDAGHYNEQVTRTAGSRIQSLRVLLGLGSSRLEVVSDSGAVTLR